MSNLSRSRQACYGIEQFLYRKGINCSTANVSKITAEFLNDMNLPHVKYNPNYKGLYTADICNAESVQKNWTKFREWVIKNYVK